MTVDSKALTEAAGEMVEAVKQARLAYQFCASSYTWTVLQACLAASKAFDQHVAELAFTHSAAWLQKFPRVGRDAE
jgi:hypothetical protein